MMSGAEASEVQEHQAVGDGQQAKGPPEERPTVRVIYNDGTVQGENLWLC